MRQDLADQTELPVAIGLGAMYVGLRNRLPKPQSGGRPAPRETVRPRSSRTRLAARPLASCAGDLDPHPVAGRGIGHEDRLTVDPRDAVALRAKLDDIDDAPLMM